MSGTTKVRCVLPAHVFDTLELSALAYGGIGAEKASDVWGVPLCVAGHAYDAGMVPEGQLGAVTFLSWYGLSVRESDAAVWAINRRRRRVPGARVPFAGWCAELGVERGA